MNYNCQEFRIAMSDALTHTRSTYHELSCHQRLGDEDSLAISGRMFVHIQELVTLARLIVWSTQCPGRMVHIHCQSPDRLRIADCQDEVRLFDQCPRSPKSASQLD